MSKFKNRKNTKFKLPIDTHILSLTAFISALVLIFILGVLLYRYYTADVYIKKSKDALYVRHDFSSAVSFAQRAVRLNPYEPSYHVTYAKAVLMYYMYDSSLNTSSKLKEPVNIKQVASSLYTALLLNPKNIVVVRNSLPVYWLLYQKYPHVIPQTTLVRIYDLLYAYGYNDAGVLVTLILNSEDPYQSLFKDRLYQVRPDLFKWHPDLLELDSRVK